MTKKKKLNPRAVLGRKMLDASDKFEETTGQDDHAIWLFRDWAASISDPDAPERVFLLKVADALEEARNMERAALLEYVQNQPFTPRPKCG